MLGTALIISTLVWTLRKGAKLQRNVANYIPLGIFLFNGLVSNLSGILCTCLIWLISFYFVTTDTPTSQDNQITENVTTPIENNSSQQNNS